MHRQKVEIARDVARKLLEAQADSDLPTVKESFDLPIIIER